MDFSIKSYNNLQESFQLQSFVFKTFSEFGKDDSKKVVLFRHDVDKLPHYSLQFAKIQATVGIKGTYYFRIVKSGWDTEIIREIAGMGHEIGYHYEDVNLTAARRQATGDRRLEEKELIKIAIDSFEKNLEKIRKIVPVKTICMHGSPMSRWDSRLLWKYFDYRDFGIVAEPYFDIDFDEVFYLTDTGRRWDGEAVSVRDKAQVSGLGTYPDSDTAQGQNPYEDWKVKPFKYRNKTKIDTQHQVHFPKYHSTSDIINSLKDKSFPSKAMITMHPQRWTDKPLPWISELVMQNMKNVVKYFIIVQKTGGRRL